MNNRLQRQLEELLKVPGNETCADCHALAPRWASVNLGIFLCVACASVHRKLGTHKSRVKSVTLDEWTREQIAAVKAIGNAASNAQFNPDEKRHPPPTTTGADERDSELEKYIRRKYELGAFRPGAPARRVPTSLERARGGGGGWGGGQAGGTGGMGAGGAGSAGGTGTTSSAWALRDAAPAPARDNSRNPELNGVLVSRARSGERELPPLPTSAAPAGSGTLAPPRPRPTRSPSAEPAAPAAPWAGGVARAAPAPPAAAPALVDVGGATSSTRPLQVSAATASASTAPWPASAFATLQPQAAPALASSPGGLSAHSAPALASSPYQSAFAYAPAAPGFAQHQQQQQAFAPAQYGQAHSPAQFGQAQSPAPYGQGYGQQTFPAGQYGSAGAGASGMMGPAASGMGMAGYGQTGSGQMGQAQMGQMGQMGQVGQMGQMLGNGLAYGQQQQQPFAQQYGFAPAQPYAPPAPAPYANYGWPQ